MTDAYVELLRWAMRLQLTTKMWKRIVAGHLLKSLRAVAFLSITIVALAGGCNHQRSTSEGTTAASKGATEVSIEVSELSPAMIGKQITIRGRLLFGKSGLFIALDNQQEVDLVFRESSTTEVPYSEMHGKRVAATGILKFYKAPPAVPTPRPVQRLPDFYYFNLETTQIRLIGH